VEIPKIFCIHFVIKLPPKYENKCITLYKKAGMQISTNISDMQFVLKTSEQIHLYMTRGLNIYMYDIGCLSAHSASSVVLKVGGIAPWE